MKFLYNKTLVRVILPLLCVIFLINMAPTASAAGETDRQGAAMAIIEGYRQNLTSIDLTDYNIPKEEMKALFTELRDSGLLPWYADWYQYRYYISTGMISELVPNNLDPQVYDYALYEATVEKILDEIIFPGMNEWQIALAIHDYLVVNCAYDESLERHESYDCIVVRSAVCEGYARAYMDLMNRAGVPCKYVISTPMNHGWNVAYVGGEWHHVDATWNDPTSNVQGRCLHDFFLKSDSMMQDENHQHHGWLSYEECPDTDWDTGWFWDDVDNPICFESADVFYVRQRSGKTGYIVQRYSMSSGQWTTVHTYDAGYVDVSSTNGYNYFYDTYGLALYGGRLYFADMTAVYSVNPDGSDLRTHYTQDCKGTSFYISGMHVSEGVLYLTLRNHNTGEVRNPSYALQGVHTHSYTSVTVEATCVSGGYTTYTCTTCGHSYTSGQTQPIEHTYGDWIITKNPTCTEQGTAYRVCNYCGKQQSGYSEPLGHDYKSHVYAPDCDSDGYTLYVCTVCGYNYMDNITAALGHDYTVSIHIPDCTQDGYTEYLCKTCGHHYTDNVIPSSGHNYQAIVTPPTCQSGGYTTYVCPGCGDHYVSDYTEPADHLYGGWVIEKQPTCTESGWAHRSCVHCNDYQEKTLEPTGHRYEDTVKVPTCNEGGYTVHTCTVCGYSVTDSYTDPHGHGYVSQVKNPTCMEGGYTVHTCIHCSYSYTSDHTDALGHKYLYQVKAPTCTEGGYTTYGCIRCGHVYTDDFTDPRGHEYGPWQLVYDSSCTQPGLQYQDCLHCSVKNFDSIPVKAHSYENGVCTGCGAEEPTGTIGDINGDGRVNSMDARMALMYDVGLLDGSQLNLAAADVNHDGRVNSMDARLILMFDVGLLESFPKP